MSQEQSVLLRKWMSAEGITRKEACERLGVKGRRFNAWLLPPASKERRNADALILEKVQGLLDESLRIAKAADSGMLENGVDAQKPYICERTGIVFPAIFREPMRCAKEVEGELIEVPSHSDMYTFACRSNASTEIHHMDARKDSAFISVVSLENYSEAEGFVLGNLFDWGAGLNLITTCEYNGAYFGMKINPEAAGLPGVIAYSTRYIERNSPVESAPHEVVLTTAFDRDGNSMTEEDVYERLED